LRIADGQPSAVQVHLRLCQVEPRKLARSPLPLHGGTERLAGNRDGLLEGRRLLRFGQVQKGLAYRRPDLPCIARHSKVRSFRTVPGFFGAEPPLARRLDRKVDAEANIHGE
jgi:hypothetical protein